MPVAHRVYLAHTLDTRIDVAAAYPNGEDINNVSHETTFRELCVIEGVSEEARRRCGINFTGGANNAIEICREIYKLPDVFTLQQHYLNQTALEQEAA